MQATILGVALLAIVYLIVRWLLDAGIIDDTYIFLRYARNFADGNGLVFNTGEHVEGYTSPLWQFLLALLAWLHVDIVPASVLLSALIGLAVIFLVLRESRQWISPGKYILFIVPGWFLATNPSFLYWAWSGMDTLIFTFFFFATFTLFLREVHEKKMLFGSGLCFTLAALSRLDILCLLPVYLAAIYLFNRGKASLLVGKFLSFLAPLLLLALHFLWRYSYYDAWLPNTFYAKVGIPTANLLQKGLAYLSEFGLAYSVYLLLSLLVLLWIVRISKELAGRGAFAFAIIFVWAGYVVLVGGDHFAMYRFFMPILPIIALLFMFAIDLISERLHLGGTRHIIAIVLGAVILIAAINFTIYERFGGMRSRGEVELARHWTDAGLWLKQHVSPQSTIASMVVGAMPYYSELRAYDLLGLTDKEVALNGMVYLDAVVGHQKYNTDYILKQRPDYIIYASSGLYDESSDPLVRDMNKQYYYSLYDIANDPRTQKLYQFQSIPMPNGRHVEFLQSKQAIDPSQP